jgi:phosphoserine aminotransferase
MLCVEDALHSLRWFEALGGLPALQQKVATNANLIYEWLDQSDWAEATPKSRDICSLTSVCFGLKPSIAAQLTAAQHTALFDHIKQLLADEAVAFDIGSYKGAPIGLRFWTGATVEGSNIQAALPWLDWAYAQATAAIS